MKHSNLSRAWVLAGVFFVAACGKEPVDEMPKEQQAFETAKRQLARRFHDADDKFIKIYERADKEYDSLQVKPHPLPSDPANPEQVNIEGIVSDIRFMNVTTDLLLTDVRQTLNQADNPATRSLMSQLGMESCAHLHMYRHRETVDYDEVSRLVRLDRAYEHSPYASLIVASTRLSGLLGDLKPEELSSADFEIAGMEGDLAVYEKKVAAFEDQIKVNAGKLSESFLKLWEQRLLLRSHEGQCREQYSGFKARFKLE